MAEILKEWLKDRLNKPITWEANDFGNKMKNGHIISEILLSYNVINSEKQYLIKASNTTDDIKNNWKYLSEWLHDANVFLNAEELKSISSGSNSALLRLFYQLFLQLDKKDRINFIKRERKMVSNLVEKVDRRFNVSAVEEVKEIEVDNLSKPLLNENHFIEWQKKKAAEVKDTYDYVRLKYSKMLKRIEDSNTPFQCYTKPPPIKLQPKEKKDIEKFALRYPCQFQNYNYDELLELEKNAEERKKNLIDSEWTKNYMENLYLKMHKKVDSEEFQKQITNVVSSAMWDSSVAEEESALDRGLAKKVMKLSQYEKQMCTQIMETKQQARNLFKNRIQAEKEYTEERESQFQVFFDNLKDQLNMELVDIDFETRRQNMLHQKLYAEKLKRKRAHYYEICYDTMLSIVDYATKYAYLQRLLDGDTIPDNFIHELKNLYFKQQPIFDILDPTESVLREHCMEEEVDEEVEEIFRAELERQNALNNCEFKEYHNYLYPWALELLIPNFDQESEDRKLEYLGNRVLGHIVFTLLDLKYPYPPALQPADLPQFTVKSLLRGIPDKAIAAPMQTLLNLRKIRVVRLESAINYCLRQFKAEMVGCMDIDLSFDKFITVAENENDKELIRSVKNEDESTFKLNESIISTFLGVLPPNAKQTQTPKTLPEREISLSASANLGRYTYEALSCGNSLTDHLMCAILVEYIKNQEDIQGFVIINYPNTYREAKILEETFAGHSPPEEEELTKDNDDIFLEETLVKNRQRETDRYKDVRISKIVYDPHKKRVGKPFVSYFTSYIKLIETQDILQEVVIWDLDEENSELIDRFYAVLGMNYSMYYEYFEKQFISQLCTYIIGDLELPFKSPDILFGENVLSQLEFPLTEDKRLKHKIVKPEVSIKSKDKIKSKTKVEKSTVELEGEYNHETSFVTEYEHFEEIEGESQLTKSLFTEEDVIVLAGDEEWDYGELPAALSIAVAMATCWEETERTYVEDLQKLFLAKRLQMNCLVPYTRFIKDKMEQIITLPSNKQDLVYQFQKEYNEFEDDWRPINFTKNEWHCRVKDFKHILYEICDNRKIFSERERQSLISENWASEELITMFNTYVSLMQAELNRSILTLQTAHDFYFTLLKSMPPNERLTPRELSKVYRETEETSGSRKGGEDKVYRQLKTAFQDMQMKNIQMDYSNNPLNMLLENNVKLSQKAIKELNETYRTLISREYSDIAKITPAVKKKEPDSVSVESLSPEESFKQNALKCIDEWLMCINGEMSRLNLRLQALHYKCLKDMKLFSDIIFKTFTEIQERIDSHYINEITSVDRLCKYFQMAIERGQRIPESLILDKEEFVIDPNLLYFDEDSEEVKETNLKDSRAEWEFKLGQLARLRTQFKTVASQGFVLQQAFIYLLQDFILFGKESCDGPIFPEMWKKIDPEKIPKLVFNLFGDTAYIDWRDFLIMTLNIRYPTVDELLALRKAYRCVDDESTELITRDVFLNQPLWFEGELGEGQGLRLNLIKHFLFELYETEPNYMNYSGFLLAFCKNINPVEGFTNALSLMLGKKTCHSMDMCEEVICKMIKDKVYRDACRADATEFVEDFIDTAIGYAIEYCAGTTLLDLPPDIDLKPRSKINRTSKSTQVPKPTLNMKSMKYDDTNSSSAVLTTYICPPCQDLEQPKEKQPEQIEEEEIPAPVPDPDLAYTVSQSTIWKLLKIFLPWQFTYLPELNDSPFVNIISDILKRLAKDTDEGDIFIAKLVNDPRICKLLHKAKQFTEFNITEEVKKIL